MFLYKKQPDTYGVLQDLKVLQLFTVIMLLSGSESGSVSVSKMLDRVLHSFAL